MNNLQKNKPHAAVPPAPTFQVVSYGAGTNSTAMVCEMVRRREPIAAVVFADTGGERPETYAHLLEFSEWLTARGYPAITTVKKRGRGYQVHYTTLDGQAHIARLKDWRKGVQ